MLYLYRIVGMTLLTSMMALSATTSAKQSTYNADSLKPYTACKLEGDLEVKGITRKQNVPSDYREVTTAKGKERVSVVDGYRVMFGYKDVGYFYANVKIEQSDAKSYAQDKEIVINELRHLSSSKQFKMMLIADKTMLSGFEHYAIEREAIDVGNLIGIHLLLYDKDKIIITIYFINQEKKKRRFNSIEEFRAIRESFLNRYTECLIAVARH
jgi:hypothetical protein